MTGSKQPEPGWLSELRQSAESRFSELGYPTTRQESWRYTSLRSWLKSDLPRANGSAQWPQFDSLNTTCARLVLTNGRVNAELSNLTSHVTSLRTALESDNPVAKQSLGQAARHNELSLSAWNLSQFDDGVFIHIPRNEVWEQPVELVFLTHANGGSVAQPRVLIVAEENSSATVVTRFIGTGGNYINNVVTEIVAQQNAFVRHLTLQQEDTEALHVSTVGALLHRDATYESTVAQMGASVGRNEIHVKLAEQGARTHLSGLYVGHNKQNLDHYTHIDHAAPHTESSELYKGVIDHQAKGTFQGRILIHEGATKSVTQQLNNNLLLSDSAEVNTKPQLEIDNDDVKAAHGATVGQLDEEALYYLRSRCIAPAAARALLIDGFVREIIDSVANEELRSQLNHAVANKLGTEVL